MDFFFLQTHWTWDNPLLGHKKVLSCHLTDMLKMSHMLIYRLECLCVFSCIHQENSAQNVFVSLLIYVVIFSPTLNHSSKYAFTSFFFHLMYSIWSNPTTVWLHVQCVYMGAAPPCGQIGNRVFIVVFFLLYTLTVADILTNVLWRHNNEERKTHLKNYIDISIKVYLQKTNKSK